MCGVAGRVGGCVVELGGCGGEPVGLNCGIIFGRLVLYY